MGQKTNLLNNLFDKWESAHSNESEESLKKTIHGENISKEFFQRDGIIDEEIFGKEKKKILFLSNEANSNNYNAAKGQPKSNYQNEYLDYFKNGKDDWRGKMRERTCALYLFLVGIYDLHYSNYANRFAMMDLNKRGGKSKIDGGQHIVEYCRVYKDFIKQEIEIIDPNIVVWIGTNTYDMGIPEMLGAVIKAGNKYFDINKKPVPILRMWHTSYYQAKITPLPGEQNKTIRKLCAKLLSEMEKFGLN